MSHRQSLRAHAMALTLFLATLACARLDGPVDYANITPIGDVTSINGTALVGTYQPGGSLVIATATLLPASPIAPGGLAATPRPTLDIAHTPTPDAPRAAILSRQSAEEYTVQRGDTLNHIGEQYGVSAGEIAQANGITITDTLYAGQVLLVPVPRQNPYGSDLKLLPDSEFVFGPGTVGFNLEAFVQSYGGYLTTYTEEIPGQYIDNVVDSATLTGVDIVRLIAQRYSISPQLLLALLEHQSHWVTQRQPNDNTLVYPLRHVEAGREGLFRQLMWAAGQLNYGYYAWRVGALIAFNFSDGNLRLIAPGLNAGTVGVQNFFAQSQRVNEWHTTVSDAGFRLTYWALFGNPFAYAFEPLVPANLIQPPMQLPFEPGKVWAFTGGPHGAWASTSAWGALDFAPPAEAEGCTPSEEWVVASAPGIIVRAEYGAVLQDLDNDGYEGTGWVLFYMHIESRDRVAVGASLNAGDYIGHPSCEGGVANGTHVHFARKYNGEWISADGNLPFVLDGWTSSGFGNEYDGSLTNGAGYVEAYDGRAALNEIQRP